MRTRWAVLVLLVIAAGLICVPSAMAADLVVQSVNTSSFPGVDLVVAVPPELVTDGAVPRFTVVENGVRRNVDSAVSMVESANDAIDVVLVLDASGSMQGRPLAAAKVAANEFIAALGPRDRIAVMAIGPSPVELTGFTEDRAALASAIGSVQAKGETALYDTLVRAGKLLSSSSAQQKYVVVLSDGGDTVSAASLDDATAAVMRAGAPAYVVALSSPEYNPTAVKALAKATRGTLLSTRQADKLTRLFQRIAAEMKTAYKISYRSADPAAADLEIAVTGKSGSASASGVAVVDNPTFEATKGSPWKVVVLSPAYRVGAWGIGIAVGLAVALGFAGLVFLLRREGTAIEQLSFYRELRSTPAGGADSAQNDPEGIRARLRAAIGQVAGEQGVTADLKRRIEQAGMKVRPDEFIYFHLIAVLGTGLIVELLTRRWFIAAVAVVIATIVPFSYMNMRASRRRARFETQLPDVIALIAGSLRAGWGIQQALDLIVEETTEPSRGEFKRVQSETRLGLSLEESLNKMADRLGSSDFSWVVSAIGIQREVGGNLAEVLDIAAGTIRERAELRREVSALTAEGRFSAIVLLVLPFFLLGGLTFIAPRYLSSMTGTLYGWFMLGFAAVLLLVGGIWLFKLTKIEV